MFNGDPARLYREGAESEAAELVKSVIADRRVPPRAGEGHVALVGAGPGARDLLTLRAVERLQEADIIFYDDLVDADVLELARRNATRVFVGRAPGASPWPKDRICAVVLAEARKGRRVVQLKSGDPSMCGHTDAEVNAARAAGVPIEIVPGVPAVSRSGRVAAQVA